jgi:tRNA(Ile)-lysidine synthase
MKYLVAVSGGIDSVVLLDALVAQGKHDLVVAHFDHGIRKDSAADSRFVAGLAAGYGLPFVTRREDLGAQASEDLARARRYAFLRDQAKKHDAVIVTAHHQDDVVESVAINLTRGTGWKGLAVLDSADIHRPFTQHTKTQLREYAKAKRLEWVEDSTNATPAYLRNRLRRRINSRIQAAQQQAIAASRQRQVSLKRAINQAIAPYIQADGRYSRHLLIMIDPSVASELLRAMIAAKTDWSPTRPQTARALVAIKTARPGSIVQVGAGATLCFTTHTFIVRGARACS